MGAFGDGSAGDGLGGAKFSVCVPTMNCELPRLMRSVPIVIAGALGVRAWPPIATVRPEGARLNVSLATVNT